MDRPENKKRIIIFYIIVGAMMIGLFGFTTWYNNMRAEQIAAENPDAAITETPEEEEPVEEEKPVELSADYCAAGGYRYRIVNDAEELAYYGLPEEITEEIMGGTFATADSKITLYAYPAYGCRAYLIAGREDAYSFCILDGLTDTTLVPTLADLLPLYGIYSTEDAFLELARDCTYAGDKTVADGVEIQLISAHDAPLMMTYDADAGLLMAGGMCFNVTDKMAELLK
ncbi:MAG: hypothetical protein E7458_10410 [Ruminococcaceae bacterium]|nr:hypothetical protein [Oscillospiraceae bacterium]